MSKRVLKAPKRLASSRPLAFTAAGVAMAISFATPAAGFAASASSDTGTARKTHEQSWAGMDVGELEDAQDLAKSVAAASRAKLRTPIVDDGCVPLETSADGVRVLTQEKRFYQPLHAGVYSTSSGYGYRVHPVTGQYAFHEGLDYAAPYGAAILAVADGVVTATGFAGTAGNRTIIRHTDTDGSVVDSIYMHQSAAFVYVGQEVRGGEHIGNVGSTGRSTGPHLHLEIRPGGGGPVNPGHWLTAHDAIFVGQECG